MGLGKIDLHLHLDGSLELDCAYRLAKSRGIIAESYPFETFRQRMMVSGSNPSLTEYLNCFDLPIAIMQDEEAIQECTRTLIHRLAKEGLIYAEIRFAPQQHCKKGLTQKRVVEAALRGRSMALKEHPEIQIQLILCMMTIGAAALNEKENWETVELAKEYLGQGVAALDLAGYEGACAITDYRRLFEKAFELRIPYTIHAGEGGPADNVKAAVEMGAWRIGHGVRCIEKAKVKQLVIDKQIPLEICLTSNLQCHVQSSYQSHALAELYHAGACVTLNTDNRTLSGVTLESEIGHALNDVGLKEADIMRMNENAVMASFLQTQEKRALLKKLKESK